MNQACFLHWVTTPGGGSIDYVGHVDKLVEVVCFCSHFNKKCPIFRCACAKLQLTLRSQRLRGINIEVVLERSWNSTDLTGNR